MSAESPTALVKLGAIGHLARSASLMEKHQENMALINGAISSAWGLLHTATSTVPVGSALSDFEKLRTGKDPVTGAAVSGVEQAVIIGTVLLPKIITKPIQGVFTKLWGVFSKVADSAPSKVASAANKLKASIKKSDDQLIGIYDDVPCISANSLHLWQKALWLVEDVAFAGCDKPGEATDFLIQKARGAGLEKPNHIAKYGDLAATHKIKINDIPDDQQQRMTDLAKSEWSRHKNKHLKAKTEADAKRISKNGDSQYLPTVDNKLLEEAAVIYGQKFPKAGGGYHVYHKFDEVIGYSEGKPTRWIRSEITGLPGTGAYHGHPRSLKDVRKKIPDATE